MHTTPSLISLMITYSSRRLHPPHGVRQVLKAAVCGESIFLADVATLSENLRRLLPTLLLQVTRGAPENRNSTPGDCCICALINSMSLLEIGLNIIY